MRLQLCLAALAMASALPGQQNPAAGERIVLGPLANGASVTFSREASGDWGIQILGAGAPRLMERKPAQIEIYRGVENVTRLGWKPGVPTIGANGIASNVPGEVDQHLDWAVPSYARLYCPDVRTTCLVPGGSRTE